MHYTYSDCKCSIATTMLLMVVSVSSANAQVNLRMKYYLTDGKATSLDYFTKRDTLLPPKIKRDTTHVQTYKRTVQGNSLVEDLIRVTTTSGPRQTKSKVYKVVNFDSDDYSFFIEHKKDTVFFESLPVVTKKKEGLNPTSKFFNANRTKATYFRVINKGSYLRLESQAREVGVVAIPARVYISLKSQKPIAKPALGAGVAAYYGWSNGNHYLYDDGTSINKTVINVAYVGFTEITVTPSNSDNKVDKDRDEPALSIGYARLFGRGTTAQASDVKIGFVIGTDIPVTSIGWKWDFSPSIYLGAVVSLSISPLKIK